ncbi:MAG: class II aldolase/adducin family protein, partial [Thermoleophilia bacterium]|nr:class II aldolase/adducin family protein [Thermoleophilia bacterium]
MQSRWSEQEAAAFVVRYAGQWGEDLALRTYSSRLIGAERALVLHGGGNSSVKSTTLNILGERIPVLYVKASGVDMATIEPEGHPGLDLDYLRRLRALAELDDAAMVNELRTHLLEADVPTPSIEALVHAFLPAKFVDHTHAGAILALTNRPEGEKWAQEALGDDVVVLPYVTPGFKLAQAAAEAFAGHPGAVGMVWAHHGIVTWGETARQSYERMIELVSRAERFLAGRRRVSSLAGNGQAKGQRQVEAGEKEAAQPVPVQERTWQERGGVSTPASAVLSQVAPILRGLLTRRTTDPDRPYERVVVLPLVGDEVVDLLSRPGARKLLDTAPLTTDHLIRVKPRPLWVEVPPERAAEEWGAEQW